MTDLRSRGALVITGPTASGKSRLAAAVAERLNGELISADSRQVYRGMDIGTAKPDPALRERVAHHGLDLLDPDEPYSAGRFARDAWGWIRGIRERGRVAIVVGGTGFFVRALLDPLGPEPELQRARRDPLRRFLARRSTAELKRWLARLDAERAERLRLEGGLQRLSRSLEVTLLSGRPHSWWLERPPETPRLEAAVVCVHLPLEALYRRIEARFDAMLEAGLLDEVRALRARYGDVAPGLRSVGYAELLSHLRGELSLADAVSLAKRNTRRFARRQLTWFRHQLPDQAAWLRGDRPLEELVLQSAELWRAWCRSGPVGQPSLASDGSSGQE